MRVVIPACGRGERFKREGYETIKPKIPIAGEPMLDAAVRSLSLDASDECVVVTNFDDAMHSERFGVVRLPRATVGACLLYTSPSPRDGLLSRMPSSA